MDELRWSINTLSRGDLESEQRRLQGELDTLTGKIKKGLLHGDSFCNAKDRVAWINKHLPLVNHWLETLPGEAA